MEQCLTNDDLIRQLCSQYDNNIGHYTGGIEGNLKGSVSFTWYKLESKNSFKVHYNATVFILIGWGQNLNGIRSILDAIKEIVQEQNVKTGHNFIH